MSQSKSITYFCDKCGQKLKTSHNDLNIVTSISEATVWSRLHVRIIHVHGVHNNANTEPAELCQECAKSLLRDALNRVSAGERASKGVYSTEQEGWG